MNHSQDIQQSGNSYVNSATFPNGMNNFEQGAHPNITSDWCTANLFKRPHDGVCSHKLFQTYFSVCGKFPDLCKWTGVSGKKFDHAKFSSPFCHVENVTGKPLQSHLIRTGVKRILIVGDSHGVRYFKALSQIVNESGYDCQSILKEQGKQKGNRSMRHYICTVWGIPEVALNLKSRGCYSCTSTLLKCSPKAQGRIIELEFLGMVLSSNFIVPNNTFCLHHTANYHNLCSAKTEKELMFKHYLQNRKPDVVIISTKVIHWYNKLDICGITWGAFIARSWLHGKVYFTIYTFRQVQTCKAGCNNIRISHNPKSLTIIKSCPNMLVADHYIPLTVEMKQF